MDSVIDWLQPYGGWGFAGLIIAFLFYLVLTGKIVTLPMLERERANDKDTISTLKEANRVSLETLPELLRMLHTIEHALKEIQQAGKGQQGARYLVQPVKGDEGEGDSP
jgi:hypothetical protein